MWPCVHSTTPSDDNTYLICPEFGYYWIFAFIEYWQWRRRQETGRWECDMQRRSLLSEVHFYQINKTRPCCPTMFWESASVLLLAYIIKINWTQWNRSTGTKLWLYPGCERSRRIFSSLWNRKSSTVSSLTFSSALGGWREFLGQLFCFLCSLPLSLSTHLTPHCLSVCVCVCVSVQVNSHYSAFNRNSVAFFLFPSILHNVCLKWSTFPTSSSQQSTLKLCDINTERYVGAP